MHERYSYLCLYPFLPAASEYVKESGLTIDHMISSASARIRAKERVIEAIRTGCVQRPFIADDMQAQMELLSYPFARILVSCINDPYLVRRYALAEAKGAYRRIIEDLNTGTGMDTIHKLAGDLGIHADISTDHVLVPFTDYLQLAVNLRDKRWKLVNRSLVRGKVKLNVNEFVRLLQEAIYGRVIKGLPLDVPEEICNSLRAHIEQIKEELARGRPKRDEFRAHSGADPDSFPPCIRNILRNLNEGVNIPHSARFAVTAFLLNAGLSVEEVIELYRNSPDFNETMTRYQVEHIAGVRSGTRYTAPSCATMRTYGNCVGKDELCDRIAHPLSYYRLKLKRRAKKPDS